MKTRRISHIAIFALLMIFTVLSRKAVAADPATQPAIPPVPGLDLTIVDADGKPVPSAHVTVNSDGKTTRPLTRDDGHVLIPPPKQATSNFSISVHADGFADKTVQWASRRTDPIPPTYTLKLEMGSRISGKVVDDAGQPVAGAHVELWISKKSDNARERYSRNASITTGADGTWTLDAVPAQGAQVEVGAWDYRYANGDYYPMSEPSAAQLRDGSFTITLARGVEVDCVVLKADGTPITGARVRSGDDFASNTIPAQRVDKDGNVVYFAKPGEQVVLTATAAGYATELTHFIMGGDKHSVQIQMSPSTPLTGQVVDTNGKPVPNAWIYSDTWRGFRSLEVRIHADRNGKFTWKDAPTDEVELDVDATQAGFIRRQNVPMTAGDQPNIVTVQRALRITGTVVDAETNQPIPSFRIVRGISFDKDRPPTWERQDVTPGRDGQFQFSENWDYPGYAVRIEADGYAPADSRIYTADEKQVKLEFKLSKGKSITFTILTPGGKPAAGAKALLLEPGQNIQINNGRDMYDRESPQATADTDGHCSFPAEAGAFKLVVLADSGYAETPSADALKTGQVHLTPWAVIHGKLMKGSKAWPGQNITVDISSRWMPDANQSRIFYSLQTTTGPDGTFTMDRVPAGSATVGRMITQQVGQFFMNTISQGQQLDISAGQTLNLALGGKGRPVEGQITIPPFLAARHDWIWDTNSTARHHSPQADIPMPDDVKNGTDDQKQKWMTAFMQSPAGKTYVDALNKEMSSPSYPTEFSNDGKFRIEDVPPGNYSLNASILMPSPQYGGYNPDGPLATAQSSFTVPEIPGGQSDEPLKLPPIQMTVIPRADVGQPAPDFAMKTADAKELKLSDFKGKYALIVFYLPGPQAARSELPILASVADSFGGENRLSMIGIDVFGPADASKNYGQPNGMSWTSASLQKAGNLSAVKSFQLKAFPSIWLIGPDGIIVAKNLQGDAVKTALTAALGPQGL